MGNATWNDLVELMQTLRSPHGCPWDRAQSLREIKTYLLEETYELLEAMEREDWTRIAEELGDLLFQIVFIAQFGSEAGRFTAGDVVAAIHAKMIERHPHVFGADSAATPRDVLVQWEQRKSRQPAAARDGILASIPEPLPALAKAQRMTSKAAHLGFDWEHPEDVLEKIAEELGEFRAQVLARANDTSTLGMRNEFGDLLFSLVNLGRQLGIDSEDALQSCNRKFRARFESMASALTHRGRSFADASLAELDALWNEAKSSDL